MSIIDKDEFRKFAVKGQGINGGVFDAEILRLDTHDLGITPQRTDLDLTQHMGQLSSGRHGGGDSPSRIFLK